MDSITMLGYLAATLTTVAFVPQVMKIWYSRSAKDISLAMFLVFSLGVLCWLVYGLMIGSGPMIFANSITLALALSILAMKLKFK
jgi:MtN3 and saliva related transmembrane protein